MRQAGQIDDPSAAARFAAFLVAEGIEARVISDGGSQGVWVRDESQIDRAKEELAKFLAEPNHERYQAAPAKAKAILRAEQQRTERAHRNLINMRDHWRRPSLNGTPLTAMLMFASIAISLFTNYSKPFVQERLFIASTPKNTLALSAEERQRFVEWLDGRDPSELDATELLRALRKITGAKLKEVGGGEVWRLVTPIFLHFGMMHLIFNMMWLYQLGYVVEAVHGTWRFAALVLLIAVLSNVAQFYYPLEDLLDDSVGMFRASSGRFGGMSGVNYGLFGYIWIRARRDRLSGFFMDDQTILLMLLWFFVCLFGLVGPIANTAHAVGLLVGVGVAYAVKAWRWRRF